METNSRINKVLKKIGVEESSLKKNIIMYLQQIEMILSSKRKMRNQLLSNLRDSDYDVKSIARETGISRTTFYSYDRIMQKYIELSHEEDYKDDPYVKIKELKEKIRCLQEENSMMMKRDCRELLLKMENDRLKQQLQDKEKTIERLRINLTRSKERL